MGILSLALLAVAADPDDGLAKKFFPLYLKEAEGYSIAVESAPEKALELKPEPVFDWANLVRGTTQGVVFVWLRDGRPAALGCFFSHPDRTTANRVIRHELQLYKCYAEMVVSPEGKVLSRVQQTPSGPALRPVEDK